MHINIIHIIIAIAIGIIASFSRGKNGKINLKRALALSTVFALVIVLIDWIRLP
jgi:hypothetical protein